MSTRWCIAVEDIPSAGFTLEVDSRDEKFLELLAEVAHPIKSVVGLNRKREREEGVFTVVPRSILKRASP